ncbi:hypothetical protein [Fictibacillus halophilus]|uniref:hypothetical protein n=1 Tax=Fictibacillus halophilus TaxID=1610490 RepID=UPI001CF953B0|nr:hypothetical protein [Fictibacillus halophilus]
MTKVLTKLFGVKDGGPQKAESGCQTTERCTQSFGSGYYQGYRYVNGQFYKDGCCTGA